MTVVARRDMPYGLVVPHYVDVASGEKTIQSVNEQNHTKQKYNSMSVIHTFASTLCKCDYDT